MPDEQRDMNEEKRWALYPWFEDSAGLIHPDDLALVRRLRPYGLVLRVLDDDGDFVRLRYGDLEFRGHRSLVRPLSIVPKEIGDGVKLADGRPGRIIAVHWHGKRQEPFYFLAIEGKKRSKRYWDADFVDE